MNTDQDKLPTISSVEGPEDNQRLLDALRQVRSQLDAGQLPDRDALLVEYSDVAEELVSCLDSLDFVNQVAPHLGEQLEGLDNIGRQAVGPLAQLDGFRIVREIGRGGMGIVYEAEQLSIGRPVALKVLPFAAVLEPKQLKRFKNEAVAAGTLDHPNIVPVYSVGCERGVHYYAMRLIDGQSLAESIAQLSAAQPAADKRAPRGASTGTGPHADTQPIAGLTTDVSSESPAFYRNVARLGIQAAEALQHAHEIGLIHRDVKPSNLLVDGQGQLWVTDFGLARMPGQPSLTVSGDLLGTLRYMSPEQAGTEHGLVDHRTDIYSLGVTLYELVTHKPPFAADNRQALLRQIAEQEPQAPRWTNHAIPRDLETIILKAMSKDPRNRYATTNRMAEDLRRFLDQRPIQARRVRPWERAWRWARRNRVVAVLAAAMACISIFVGVAGSVVGLRQTRLAQEKDRVAETLRRLLYVSQVRNAYQAWDEANLTRVQELLSRQQPDLRGFEWYHLSAQLARIAATPRLEHDSAVMGVAYSPDGNVLAAACGDGTVKLWDLGFMRLEPIATLRGHSDAAACVAFSPDGEALAVGSRDKSITVWQVATGQPLWKANTHCGQVRSLAYAPDGQTLAANSGELVQLWDTSTGQETAQLRGHTAIINAMAFSPDGSLLASGSFDHTVRLWDVPSRTLKQELRHTHRVYAVAFSPDGQTLASGGYNYEIRLWDVPTGAERETIRVVGHSPRTLAFSPDGDVLASGGRDNVVRLWHGRTGQPLTTIKRHSGEVRALAFSPGGRTLAAGGHDRLVMLWELADRVLPQRNLTQGTWLTPICFLSDGRSLVISTGLEGNESAQYKSGDLWILDVETGKKRVLPNRDSFLFALAISRDEKYLAAGGKRGSSTHGEIQLWDLNACTRLVELERRLDLQWSTGVVWSVAFSPDAAVLAVGGGVWPGPGEVKLWHLDAEQPPRTLRGDMGRVLSLAFSPDGRVLAVGGNTWGDTNLALWDVESGKRLAARVGHAEETPGYGTACVTFSSDGKLLASAGHDKAVMLWEMPSLSRRKKLTGHFRELGYVAFSPNGKTLASAGGDAKVKLWHVPTGGELATLKGRTGYFSVTFSPDGKTLAASDVNKTVTLWHASTDKQHWPVRLR